LDLLQALKTFRIIKQQKVAIRAFCDAIVRVLPRELRDMIYGYLLPDNEVIISGDDLGEDENGGILVGQFKYQSTTSYKNDLLRPSDRCHPLPYRPSSEILGPKFAYELSEYFHRHTRFTFANTPLPIISKCMEHVPFDHPIKNWA
jgi:hypothetical protein